MLRNPFAYARLLQYSSTSVTRGWRPLTGRCRSTRRRGRQRQRQRSPAPWMTIDSKPGNRAFNQGQVTPFDRRDATRTRPASSGTLGLLISLLSLPVISIQCGLILAFTDGVDTWFSKEKLQLEWSGQAHQFQLSETLSYCHGTTVCTYQVRNISFRVFS